MGGFDFDQRPTGIFKWIVTSGTGPKADWYRNIQARRLDTTLHARIVD